MKKFMAVFTGSQSCASFAKWQALDPETRTKKEQAGMEAWTNWAKEHSRAIVEQGGPLGKTKKIDPNGITDTRNNMSAYTVVKAESHESAAKLFINHPHFSIFPGDSVEIMEVLPIPQMK